MRNTVEKTPPPPKIKVADRASTPLGQWLKSNGHSLTQLAKDVGVCLVQMQFLAYGQRMPGLVTAFKIEQATRGEVPAISWLATELGKYQWTVERRKRANVRHKCKDKRTLAYGRRRIRNGAKSEMPGGAPASAPDSDGPVHAPVLRGGGAEPGPVSEAETGAPA